MQLPSAQSELTLTPKLRVFVNAVPAGNLVFKIRVLPDVPASVPTFIHQEAQAFRKPFLSYAKEDRALVLRAAQVIRALRMEYFQDILKIDPGERWERRLYQEIEQCDVFLLFWSHYASASKWVVKEAELALQYSKTLTAQKRLEIVPVILEGPPPPDPPTSLREINFNDPLRCIIFAEESAAKRKIEWAQNFGPNTQGGFLLHWGMFIIGLAIVTAALVMILQRTIG
jgi:hypothetical protein